MFFSPFANIWEHSFPEGLLGEAFAEKDIDVVAVRCGSMLKVHCVAMSAAAVGPDASLATREQVCKACIKRRDLITQEMGISSIIMDERVDSADRAAIDRLVSEVRPDTWTSLEVDSIPLGRYAAYEMWINHKLVSTDLGPEVWPEFLGQLRNTLLTYFTAKRILAAEKPDAVIVYNDHYSVNHAFCAAAQLQGILSYTTHGGNHIVRRGETLSLFRSNHTMEDVFRSVAWKEFQANPIGASEIELVGSHFDGLLEASSGFAYSSPFKGTGADALREKLSVPAGKTVLLAAMSSEDELMAVRLIDAIPTNLTQESLFPDQFEWVDFLFDYARAHPDVHLVLRLHPRMFPNKREQVTSPVVSKIMAQRGTTPDNVTFNMPADGIGLYDLMQIVDVLLNFRSSVGAELAAFGIPVVVPANSDFFTYPSEINRVGHTREEYAEQIDSAIVEGWSIENTRRSFRWFAFLFGRVVVDFSDAVSSRPIALRPRKPGIRLWVWKKLVYVLLQYGPLIRERVALRNRRVAPSSKAVLVDVVTSHLESASDSTLWPPIVSSVDQETTLLEKYLKGIATTLWSGIETNDSLAGRVRALRSS